LAAPASTVTSSRCSPRHRSRVGATAIARGNPAWPSRECRDDMSRPPTAHRESDHDGELERDGEPSPSSAWPRRFGRSSSTRRCTRRRSAYMWHQVPI
jgi:hypothetical protein